MRFSFPAVRQTAALNVLRFFLLNFTDVLRSKITLSATDYFHQEFCALRFLFSYVTGLVEKDIEVSS